MRARNIANDLEAYAVAGTHTAVLSLDFKTKPQNLLGLAFERRDHTTGLITWLEGQKCFRSIVPNPVKGQKYPTHLHPIQGLLWKDFTLVPGREYTFKITPVRGTPSQLQYGTPTEITVKAEKEWDGRQGVYFNRGVSGSQSYSQHFPAGKISAMPPATRERAFEWLSRGLFEGLKAFIERAEPDERIYGAFYEFHEPRTLALLKAARTRGVTVQLVVDGKQYGEDNRAAVKKAGIASMVKKWRMNAKIPHNKFMVRCSKSDTPIELWTGSTNISEKGIFGQCNTGHALKDGTLAGRYLDYWKELKKDPAKANLVAAVMALQADVAADDLANDAITAFFSPRGSLSMLSAYAELVHDARELACGMFPFNVDKVFQDAFNAPKDFPRYVIVDKSSNKFEP
ncbi:MAG TPA: phospholipase D-like domain-containing protein, partial [Burkholderiales bacterium]|nr:phospholipase D-like domain-containing protein [Burkholderiales bacterium]